MDDGWQTGQDDDGDGLGRLTAMIVKSMVVMYDLMYFDI